MYKAAGSQIRPYVFRGIKKQRLLGQNEKKSVSWRTHFLYRTGVFELSRLFLEQRGPPHSFEILSVYQEHRLVYYTCCLDRPSITSFMSSDSQRFLFLEKRCSFHVYRNVIYKMMIKNLRARETENRS